MVENRETELEDFKRQVNLVAYAGSLGYCPSANESSTAYVVLRHDNGDKVVVTKSAQSQHWIYFSVRDNTDNGTIIDFVQNRSALNLGHLRKELRGWLTAPQPIPTAENFQAVKPSTFDRQAVIKKLASYRVCESSSYLRARGIDDAILTDERFSRCVYLDNRENIIFPHRDSRGVTGYEMKNDGFTGFAKDARRALWLSNKPPQCEGLFFVESAIDALSHFVLYPHTNYHYASIGGALGGQQQPVIANLSKHYDSIVAGFDDDPSGNNYASILTELVDQTVRRLTPTENDWNNVLTSRLVS